jgi:hypothetical protein
MKNLFNDISQDEKNRILEMHSGKKNIISEQGIQQIPDFGAETQPSPTPKPSPKPNPRSAVLKVLSLINCALARSGMMMKTRPNKRRHAGNIE